VLASHAYGRHPKTFTNSDISYFPRKIKLSGFDPFYFFGMTPRYVIPLLLFAT
jgi:hypothetical protein